MSEAPNLADDLSREPTLADEIAMLGDGIFEFVNLREKHTGVPGVLFLSTILGGHGPRVKFYVRAGRDQPSFSVSIEATPRVLANSLPAREMQRAAPTVIAWVRLNREALLRFWNEGESWDVDEIAAFTAGLERV